MDESPKAISNPPNVGAGVQSDQSEHRAYRQYYPGGGARLPETNSLQVSEESEPTVGSISQNKSGFTSPHSPQAESIANSIGLLNRTSGEPFNAPRNVSNDCVVRDLNSVVSRNPTASPAKAQSYSQLRNTSSPVQALGILGRSSPTSPLSKTSTASNGQTYRPESRSMPRTSSIDSAISTISVSRPHDATHSLDTSTAGTLDISNLVRAAGSPEAVIRHLLKEKHTTDARNAQLWKLVDKQRSMVLGLNQDLERALKDKERFRKRLKEYQRYVPSVPDTLSSAPALSSRVASRSPVPSDALTDLPVQEKRFRDTEPIDKDGILSPVSHGKTGSKNTKSIIATKPAVTNGSDDSMKRSTQGTSANHSHKKTSSSDIGINSYTGASQQMLSSELDSLDQTRDSDNQYAMPVTQPVVSSATSFTAKRSHPFSTKSFNGLSMALNDSAPPSSNLESMTPPRKAPPAPLDLGQPKSEQLSQDHATDKQSESEYDDSFEVDELPALDRGRKKTREDDDREREAALLREKQDQSRSKKERDPKTSAESIKVLDSGIPNNQQEQQSLTSAQRKISDTIGGKDFLSPPVPTASVLKSPDSKNDNKITERSINMKPISPGLPLSPRPSDRPVNPPTPRMPRDGVPSSITSPPLSPKNGMIGLPLSPRDARQPVPLPPHTPMSIAPSSPMVPEMESHNESTSAVRGFNNSVESTLPSIETQMGPDFATSPKLASEAPKPNGIFKGFASEMYPGLLLPPNALPSIRVKVVSSRLKPSRHSLIIKGTDDEPVFTLGVSARYDQRDLWQVERPIMSLHQLDQQLRQSHTLNAKIPDRSLFTGHAPAKIDARRLALENYFEAILDTPMDEKEAIVLCKYLSWEPLGTDGVKALPATIQGSPNARVLVGNLAKEGYLTKRGKNFGGWKARYFMLKDPVLRYYETPGGALLGEIKLHQAQIGKQSPNKSSNSPSGGDDHDSQYRHAFLIRQPKRKDSNSFMDHVLCAESDIERDSWVAALLCYVEGSGLDSISNPPATSDLHSSRPAMPPSKNSMKETVLADSPESETFESLQAVPYEDTRPAQAPRVRVTQEPRPTDSPSPTTSGSQPSIRAFSAQSRAISGPQNGAKISDVGAWGNKPIAASLTNSKEQKKRSIWGFRDKTPTDIGVQHPNDSNLSLTQQQYQEQITNVKPAFGLPLAEAVEHCRPHDGSNVHLPAVVYRCLEYLEAKDAASEEGIFRMSGSNVLIKGLKNRFNTEGDFNFLAEDCYYDVHAVASLLKLYLRELPSMILTRELHLRFLSILEIKEDIKKVAAYNALVHKLPTANFYLLRALACYLIQVVNKSDVNLMSIRNVCIVFSPTLNIPTPIFASFLTDFDDIFGEMQADNSIPALEITESTPLTPEDIRSPGRQIFSDIPTPSYSQDSFAHNQQTWSDEHDSSSAQKITDTGFIPIQPAYDRAGPAGHNSGQQPESAAALGPEYAVSRPGNLGVGAPAKARRRESSMLLVGSAQGKSSLFSSNSDTLDEEREEREPVPLGTTHSSTIREMPRSAQQLS